MKNKDKRIDFTDPTLTAWELFEKSGHIAYYLLYKNLREK